MISFSLYVGWVPGGFLLHLQQGRYRQAVFLSFPFSFVAFSTQEEHAAMQPWARQKVRARKTISLWLLSHFSGDFNHFLLVFLHWLYGIERLFFEIPPGAFVFGSNHRNQLHSLGILLLFLSFFLSFLFRPLGFLSVLRMTLRPFTTDIYPRTTSRDDF